MKVNVQVRDETSGLFHADTLDMYHARHHQGGRVCTTLQHKILAIS